MKNESVIRAKITQILREQIIFNPEPVIAQMEKGNYIPACDLIHKISHDTAKRCDYLARYSNSLVEVMKELAEAVNS